MNNCSYEVQIDCIELSDFLQIISRKHGWKVWKEMRLGGVYPYIVIYPHESRVDWNADSYKKHKALNIVEAINILKQGPMPEITTTGCKVSFQPDGSVKIGCTVVPIETIDAIHKQAHATLHSQTSR